MAFIRIRTVNGRQYRYLEERYREGGKVKSRSRYLGPAGAAAGGGFSILPMPIPKEQQGWKYIERLMEKYPPTDRDQLAASEKAQGVKLGPTNPMPIEKTPYAPAPPAAASAADATQSVPAEVTSSEVE